MDIVAYCELCEMDCAYCEHGLTERRRAAAPGPAAAHPSRGPMICQWTSQRVPTLAYEFNDGGAPLRFPPPIDPPVATHGSEIPYLFDLPDAPLQGPLNPDQEALAASMRAAWASFAASGDPASAAHVRWPSFGGADRAPVLSLVPPRPQVETDFVSRHHCAFWAATR
jgi:para-nitrobenzyl esterase